MNLSKCSFQEGHSAHSSSDFLIKFTAFVLALVPTFDEMLFEADGYLWWQQVVPNLKLAKFCLPQSMAPLLLYHLQTISDEKKIFGCLVRLISWRVKSSHLRDVVIGDVANYSNSQTVIRFGNLSTNLRGKLVDFAPTHSYHCRLHCQILPTFSRKAVKGGKDALDAIFPTFFAV